MNTDYPLLLELNNYFKGFVDKFKTKVITIWAQTNNGIKKQLHSRRKSQKFIFFR